MLSFGTAGCNLGCRFCQNWDISKSREIDTLADEAAPEAIAARPCARLPERRLHLQRPGDLREYALDAARACRARGLKAVAVTAGYITEQARGEFYAHMDAANVDLKAFTETFYHKLCFAALQPVLDTLVWLKRETSVWFEVTTLLIPGHNDSDEEIERLCGWFYDQLGPAGAAPFHGLPPRLQR
ncbi:MAG: hypothetical protein KatS3mg102_0024 [Planctomycetota bacterium]|nr:MAG: hypothetical protein KatS3mg102_0024 [Planctomycetota bacterium]